MSLGQVSAPEQVLAASKMVWVAAVFAVAHQVCNFIASVLNPYSFQHAMRDYFGDNLGAEAAKAGMNPDDYVQSMTVMGLGVILVFGLLFYAGYALAGRAIRKGKNWARLIVMFGAFWLGVSMALSFFRSPESTFAQAPVSLELVDGIAVICAGVAAIAAQVLLSSKHAVEFFIKAYEAKHGPINRPRT